MNTHTFIFRAPDDLSALIRNTAAERGEPLSVLIRDAIRKGAAIDSPTHRNAAPAEREQHEVQRS